MDLKWTMKYPNVMFVTVIRIIMRVQFALCEFVPNAMRLVTVANAQKIGVDLDGNLLEFLALILLTIRIKE